MKKQSEEKRGLADLNLDGFKAEEERIRRDTEALNKEMRKKLDESEKAMAAVREERRTEEKIFDSMISDYEKLDTELRAKEEAAIRERSATKADLDAGKISAADFFERGMAKEEIEEKARDFARTKLRELLLEIRKKARAILDLEVRELEAQDNVYFCSTLPGQNEITRLKVHLKLLEGKVMATLYGWPQHRARLDELRRDVQGLYGRDWWGLDEAGLRRLRFDPRIPESLIPRLDEAIAEAEGSGKTFHVMLRDPGTKKQDLSWLEESPPKKKRGAE